MTERLTASAIQRNGNWETRGFHTHWELRNALAPSNPEPHPGDVEGFFTSSGRFVSRREAVVVGLLAGQLHERWENTERDLLSSDIGWNEGNSNGRESCGPIRSSSILGTAGARH